MARNNIDVQFFEDQIDQFQTSDNRTPVRLDVDGEPRTSLAVPLDLTYHQTVDVRLSKRTMRHDVIGGDTIVQILGDSPSEIDVQGPITEDEKQTIEKMVEKHDTLDISSDEWEGTVGFEDVRIEPMDARHEGNWLYRLDMGVVEIGEIIEARGTTDDTDDTDDEDDTQIEISPFQ